MHHALQKEACKLCVSCNQYTCVFWWVGGVGACGGWVVQGKLGGLHGGYVICHIPFPNTCFLPCTRDNTPITTHNPSPHTTHNTHPPHITHTIHITHKHPHITLPHIRRGVANEAMVSDSRSGNAPTRYFLNNPLYPSAVWCRVWVMLARLAAAALTFAARIAVLCVWNEQRGCVENEQGG